MRSCRGSKEACHAPRVKRDTCGSLHGLQSSSNVIILSLSLIGPGRVPILPPPHMYSADEKDKLNLYARISQGGGNGGIQGDIPLNVSASAGADRNSHTFATFTSGRARHQKDTPHPEQGRCHCVQRYISSVLVLYCWRPHLSMDGVLVSVVFWA